MPDTFSHSSGPADAVGSGLRVLHVALRRFVEYELAAKHGAAWERVARSSLLNVPTDGALDVAALLQIIEKNWSSVFVRRLSQNDRGHVSELRGVRNQWAHQRPFSHADVARALDTMHRLLRSIGATDEAQQVGVLLQSVRPDPPGRDAPEPGNSLSRTRASIRIRNSTSTKPLRPEIADLAAAFVAECGPTFRPFGTPALGFVGGSDDAEGVQWNVGLNLATGEATLGVNLEGMTYDGWPVARLIEAELEVPELPHLARETQRGDAITVRWARDCWQAASRVKIREAAIAPTPIALSALSAGDWHAGLRTAYQCLDVDRAHRGRAKQVVTLFTSGVRAMKEVSPHLSVGLSLGSQPPDGWIGTLRAARSALQPVYDWAVRRTSK